jgi:glycosyltransferase involved in cell wall biosynthesis
MKILHFIYDHLDNPWVGGGGAIRCHELNSLLAAKGHHITVVSGKYPGAEDYSTDYTEVYNQTHNGGSLSYQFAGCAYDNYLLSTLSYANMAAGLVRKLGKNHDIIIEDFAPWNPIMSRFLTNRPVMLQVHHREGFSINKRWPVVGFPFYLIEKFYPRLFENVCAVSEPTAIKFGTPWAELIPNGIDPGLLAPNEPRVEENFILYLGRLEIANKGLDTLIEAVRILNVDGKAVRLVLAGRGRDEARLKELASGLPVEFAGFVDDKQKKELLATCMAFVLPSRFEGWGIVAMEAAASGAPVIVSSIPELSYAVNKEFGLSFTTGDHNELASIIKRVASEPELRSALSENGIRTAQSYTWDKIADQYETHLLNLADANK